LEKAVLKIALNLTPLKFLIQFQALKIFAFKVANLFILATFWRTFAYLEKIYSMDVLE
jgi:hypothetical protein